MKVLRAPRVNNIPLDADGYSDVIAITLTTYTSKGRKFGPPT